MPGRGLSTVSRLLHLIAPWKFKMIWVLAINATQNKLHVICGSTVVHASTVKPSTLSLGPKNYRTQSPKPKSLLNPRARRASPKNPKLAKTGICETLQTERNGQTVLLSGDVSAATEALCPIPPGRVGFL